jgi:hypothetical protein
MPIPDPVRTLERELRGVFGARLQSLVIYGLRNANHVGATRTLAVVESLTEQDLRGCAARLAAWHAAGLATPLLVPEAELDRSLDVFPLEFSAIIADHVLVTGPEPFAQSSIEPADLRRACEIQARGHLLHLREGFVEAAGNGNALAILLVDSAAPLNALLTSVTWLEGRSNFDPSAAARHVERVLGVHPGSIAEIARLTGVPEIPAADAERLFPAYLIAVERLVAYVDGWANR